MTEIPEIKRLWLARGTKNSVGDFRMNTFALSRGHPPNIVVEISIFPGYKVKV